VKKRSVSIAGLLLVAALLGVAMGAVLGSRPGQEEEEAEAEAGDPVQLEKEK
jgi:hypothetical protein